MTKDEALRLAIESLCCVRDMVGHPDNLEYIDHQVAKIEAELEAKNEPMEFFDWYDNAHWGNEDFKEGCHRSWNAAIKYTAKPNQEAKDEPSCKECEIAYCSAKGKNFDICSQYVPPKDKRQQALERKAENARELGLDYEPLEAKDEPPRFPTMLRKMWSGSEVQDWINEHWVTPPQRKPLTDGEIDAIVVDEVGLDADADEMHNFARAIEAAHGIKGEA